MEEGTRNEIMFFTCTTKHGFDTAVYWKMVRRIHLDTFGAGL